MSKEVYFSNMFPDYEPPEAVRDALTQAVIVAADIDPHTCRVRAAIHSETYIPLRALEEVSREIGRMYGLNAMELVATHPASQLSAMDPEDLLQLFVFQNPMTRGSLAGAQWSWEDTHLLIKLKANGKAEIDECIPQVQNALRERFAAPVTITVEAGKALEGKELFQAMESMKADAMKQIPKPNFQSAEKKADKPAAAPGPGDTIYGKPIRGDVIPMKDLDLNMGFVVVEGRVFNVEHKELKKRNAWVINFDMTDNTNSVRINRFMEAGEAKAILDNVKVGSILKIQGKLELNRYDSELVLKPFSIMPGSMPKRKDTAPGGKRVELHLHTIMSNMDALTNTAAAVKQAADWGHRAIAITDHGCCQSFTDALHTVEGKKPPKVAGTDEVIKILYGCEGYYVNDVDDRIVVHGDRDMAFCDEFVAFDLETTGLSARDDRIIEIGAVIMKDGQEIDRFQTFVDPHRKLEQKIIDLTGITDQMLKGAPEIEEILPKFLEFVGDRVLVAHNADFDTGFIRAECGRQGIP